MPQDDFAFAVARVAVVQALRKSGFDKAQPGVVNACTGLVTRYLAGLGRHAQQAAMQERRTDVQVTDVRQALENMGVIPPVDDARAAIGPFAAWLESDDFLDHERIQGVVDPLAVTEPAEKLDDWLTRKTHVPACADTCSVYTAADEAELGRLLRQHRTRHARGHREL